MTVRFKDNKFIGTNGDYGIKLGGAGKVIIKNCRFGKQVKLSFWQKVIRFITMANL